MDESALIFIGVLLAIGFALIAVVRTSLKHAAERAEGEDARALRQRELRAERRMQRRRWRVWHRVDDLHALFVERTAEKEGAGRLLQSASPPPAGEGELTVLGGVDFTIPDLQTSYELFLREDFLRPAASNRPNRLHPSA
jgi:hypothetical protein